MLLLNFGQVNTHWVWLSDVAKNSSSQINLLATPDLCHVSDKTCVLAFMPKGRQYVGAIVTHDLS